MIVEGIRDVVHYYVQPPATAETTPTYMNGRFSMTNYQIIFTSYANDPNDALRIPLGFIGRAEKITIGDMPGIELICKDSRNVRFLMRDDNVRGEVLNAIRDGCTVSTGEYMKFFAYNYHSPFEQNGWLVYDVENEYIRQGVLGSGCGWRLTRVNRNFKLCDTYPPLLVVPAGVNDEFLMEEAGFRSRRRIPVLSWRSNITGVSITRCSQPCTGLKGKTSDVDQQYMEFVRLTNAKNNETLHILDSRPKANALANRARGGGYEDTGGMFYGGCTLDFENIPNIHVVREGFEQVKQLSQPELDESACNWYLQLEQSHWMEMARVILLSVYKGVKLVDRDLASLVIHCSDGWDRTAQCCALTELCLDEYYRTVRGFEVLIEKDWISFGHKFHLRYGHGDIKPSDQRSPIFPQFLFCVYQLLLQYPYAFQFNENLLITILDELYTCRFGTFLFNSERERKKAAVRDNTTSLWSYVNANVESFINPFYDPCAGALVIYPDPSYRKLRMWDNYFYRWYYKLEGNTPLKERREKKPLLDLAAELKLGKKQ